MNKKKADLVAECVADCWIKHGTRTQLNTNILAGLLWAIARGTRWEEDARNGIEGICPEFFKDDTDEIQLPRKRAKSRNPKTQFELHTFDYDLSVIRNGYDWCLKNLPLKDEGGIKYRVDQLYIITSSQKILDKVNEHFGSNFSFNAPISQYTFIITKNNNYKKQ